MKIGIIYTSYNCEKYVDESLEPWLRLKDEFNIKCNLRESKYFKSNIALELNFLKSNK